MLKIEKKSKPTETLSLAFREKDSFFNQPILWALGIALAFHTLLGILFQATPFHLPSTFTFPPVEVAAEFSLDEGEVVNVLDKREENEIFPPPPLSLFPVLPELMLSEVIATSRPLAKMNALEIIENKVWPRMEVALPIKLEVPRIQMSVGGELAGMRLREKPSSLLQMKPLLPIEEPVYFSYRVRVEANTGEIFWFEKLEDFESDHVSGTTTIEPRASKAGRKAELEAENILYALRFIKDKDEQINGKDIAGRVDFAIFFDDREFIKPLSEMR